MVARAPYALPLVLLFACDAFRGGDDDASHPESTATPGGAGSSDGAASSGHFGAAVDVAVDESSPGPIVVDEESVYVLDLAGGGKNGALVKLAKSGGGRTVLAAELPSPVSLASDATQLFVSENDGNNGSFQRLLRQAKAGGGAASVQLTANDEIAGITVHGGLVYFSLAKNGTVAYLDTQDPFSLQSQGIVAQNVGPARVLAADATHVYAGSAGKIIKIDEAAHTAEPFATTAGAVNAIVLDDDAVYWTESGAVRRLGKATPGAAPVELALQQDGATAIALDAESVFWTTVGDGAVRRVAKTGGAATTIARGEAAPTGLALDATAVWWTNRASGRVRRAPRIA